MEEKSYLVSFRVDGRYVVEVYAKDVESAKEKATQEYMDADFGELGEVVDDEIVTVEDEHGNIVWEY